MRCASSFRASLNRAPMMPGALRDPLAVHHLAVV